MNNNKQINLFIGLNDNENKPLNKESVIKTIGSELKKIGCIGYNITNNIGYWNGSKEDSLKVSFVNTFNITPEELNGCIESLKVILKQDAILKTQQQTNYNFI